MSSIFSYIRVSSKGQVEQDGPERQRDTIAKFLAGNNLTLDKEFFEEGVSGTVEHAERPAFSDLLEQSVFGDAIVVERMDRLARDLMVNELLLAECRKRGIKVYAADQGLVDVASDSGDPTRVLIRQLMAALAQWDKSNLVRRLRSARERAKAAGKFKEGERPFGFYKGEKEALDFIKGCFRRHDKPSYRAMANMLNLAGLRNRDGKPWGPGSIYNLLKRYGLKDEGKNSS